MLASFSESAGDMHNINCNNKDSIHKNPDNTKYLLKFKFSPPQKSLFLVTCQKRALLVGQEWDSIFFLPNQVHVFVDCTGSVVECLTQDWVVVGLSPSGGTVFMAYFWPIYSHSVIFPMRSQKVSFFPHFSEENSQFQVRKKLEEKSWLKIVCTACGIFSIAHSHIIHHEMVIVS